MKKYIKLSFVFCSMIALMSLWSCSEDDNGVEVFAPVITEIDPTSGPVGDEIIIVGRNLSEVASENIVTFNGIEATVTEVNPTEFSTHLELTTTIPEGVEVGEVPVTITVGELTSQEYLFKVSAMSTIIIPVTQGEDDVEEGQNGYVALTSSDLELGEYDTWADQGVQTIGVRFNDIQVPSTATIKEAYIQFTCDATGSDPVQLTIYGDDVANSPVFEEIDFNVTSRARTVAKAVWDVPAWVNKGDKTDDQKSVDLSNIVQHLISKADWEEGNSISFILVPTGPCAESTSSSGGREAESIDGDAAPELIIVFEK